MFGSARTPEDHPDYQAAVRFSRTMAESGWMVITGAGDGIMRAGHAGSGKESAFGVAIRLPFETNANDVIVGDPKLVTFRYFFTRKLMFMWMSHAVALFPGGFGTLDEFFETLTLIQTGRMDRVPVLLFGKEFWGHVINMEALAEEGTISPDDTDLFTVVDTAEEGWKIVSDFYGLTA